MKMAFKMQVRYGDCERFWTNIDKLQRILICFSKDTVPSETNLQSYPNEDQNKAMDATLSEQTNFDSQCLNKEVLLKKIENIFQNFITKSEPNNLGSIQIPNRQLWKNTSFQLKKGIKMVGNPTLKTVGGRKKGSKRKHLEITDSEAKCSERTESEMKFARFMHILTKIYKLIETNSYRTKRDLFYQDVSLFGTQKNVDDILDDISCLLQTPKIQLHVTTTSKGCISGNLRYKESDGSYVDCSESNQGVLIPTDVDKISHIQSDARFVLVVEKNTVFQMLLDCNITELLHPCIMITGKGFPDVNTRLMLRKLFDVLKIPILALMDADPYGVEILCVYKYGSRAMSFDVEKLAVPEMCWIGLLPSDIQGIQFPKTKSATIPITDRDRAKIEKLMQRPYIQNNIKWQEQIQILQDNSVKAEIEGLSKISEDFLAKQYLPYVIRHGRWI